MGFDWSPDLVAVHLAEFDPHPPENQAPALSGSYSSAQAWIACQKKVDGRIQYRTLPNIESPFLRGAACITRGTPSPLLLLLRAPQGGAALGSLPGTLVEL